MAAREEINVDGARETVLLANSPNYIVNRLKMDNFG